MNEEIKQEYMEDALGRKVPVSAIKEVDILRDRVVRDVLAKTTAMQQIIENFRHEVLGDVEAFLSLSAEQHNVKFGGKKGGLSLLTYDGKFKIVIANQDSVSFNEKLQVARELIDKCILGSSWKWSVGARDDTNTLHFP